MTYQIIEPPRGATPNLFWSTYWDSAQALGDWRVTPLGASLNAGGLDARDALASAVVISLFTDRRAPEGWRPEIVDRRGWWGDGVPDDAGVLRPIGSHLWLLRNEVVSEDVINRARIYAEEALIWMVEDEVCARISVTSGAIENPRRGVWLDIELFARDGGTLFAVRYQRFWDEVR